MHNGLSLRFGRSVYSYQSLVSHQEELLKPAVAMALW